jgi:hypothetical protein
MADVALSLAFWAALIFSVIGFGALVGSIRWRGMKVVGPAMLLGPVVYLIGDHAGVILAALLAHWPLPLAALLLAAMAVDHASSGRCL